MNLLIAAATPLEIAPFIAHLAPYRVEGKPESYNTGPDRISVCITGVGSTPAAWAVTRALVDGPFDVAVQAGIAGSFDATIPRGEVLRVRSDCFGDLGAEEGDRFLDLFEMGLQDPDAPPFTGGRLLAPEPPLRLAASLRAVDAVTVSTITGRASTLQRLSARYRPVTESMEGAAFHYACLQAGVGFVQIRSISNQVGVRDKSRWDIPLAVERLNAFLIRLIQTR
jgi:futalosine hydrolase